MVFQQLEQTNLENYPLLKEKQKEQEKRERKENAFSCMISRLCVNKEPYFWKKKCLSCGGDFELHKEGKNKGKPIIYQDYCGNPYCDESQCVKYRIGFAKLGLKSYFYAFPTWRERKQKWLHLIIGQKRIKNPTSENISLFRKNTSKFLNFLRKELRNPHIIAVFDQSFNGETYYFHFHVAMRIRGHMDYKYLQEKAKGFNVGFHKADGGYSRKPKGLINYFAKRLSGRFEHENKGSAWGYSDKFSHLEYFNLFHRKKRFLTKGFNSKFVKEIKKKFKEGSLFINTIGVVCSTYPNNDKCVYCGFFEFDCVQTEKPDYIDDLENFGLFSVPPPPPNQNFLPLVVEIVKLY